jgi:uncharacterized protein
LRRNASSSGRAAFCAGVVVEDFVRPAKGGAYLKIRVSPGAKSTAVNGLYGEDAIRLSVAAPPIDGRANAEAERYLATLIGVERSRVAVVKGASSRDKLVLVEGVEPEAVREGLVGLVR